MVSLRLEAFLTKMFAEALFVQERDAFAISIAQALKQVCLCVFPKHALA